MNRRRMQARRAGHERWLVSYADLITLLFAFFVVLYASSQVDKVRMGQLATAIQGAFQQLGAFQRGHSMPAIDNDGRRFSDIPGASTNRLGLPQDEVMTVQESEAISRELQDVLANEITRGEVALRSGPEGLIVSLREVGFFESGAATLKRGAESTMARIAYALRSHRVMLRVEGHTDDLPIHTRRFASNWELSTARATEVVKLLISKYEFAPDRLSAAGFGEFHPIAPNSTQDGQRQNRRVDLVILRKRSGA